MTTEAASPGRKGRSHYDPVATPVVGRLAKLDPEGETWREREFRRLALIYKTNAHLLAQAGAHDQTPEGSSI